MELAGPLSCPEAFSCHRVAQFYCSTDSIPALMAGGGRWCLMMPDSVSLWLVHDVCPHCQVVIIRWGGKTEDVRYHERNSLEALCHMWCPNISKNKEVINTVRGASWGSVWLCDWDENFFTLVLNEKTHSRKGLPCLLMPFVQMQELIYYQKNSI